LRSGQDRRPGPPDAAGLGSSLQRGRVWRASSTTGRRVPSLVFRRSNWLSSRRSSRPARIVRRTGSSCWRRLDLKRVIAERFGVAFHERYVGKLLKKLGFSPMSARPRHAQNERVVEAFKTYGPPRLREIIRERR
jgi:transposase